MYKAPDITCHEEEEQDVDEDYLDSNEDNESSWEPMTCTNTIRVYTSGLHPHLTYKTVRISQQTTSKEVIMGLLNRFRMKHRDPKLFYLTMEVNVNQSCDTISLGDNSLLSELISCNPWADCRFLLCSQTGGLVRIYDHLVRPDSVYKCVIISRETTVKDTLTILSSYYHHLQCCHLYLSEYCDEYERVVPGDQYPLQVMQGWGEGRHCRFVLKYCSTDTVPEQSIRKRESLKTRNPKLYSEDYTTQIFYRTVDINIDSDTGCDTESDDTEHDDTEHDIPGGKEDSISSLEEEDIANNSVIIDSFFT